MKRLDLILNGKGGVGKSFFAVNFVQFLKDKNIAHVAIDSDNENSTLKRFHPDTRFLDLDNRRALDGIFGALEKANLVVMDCRAASTDLFIDYFTEIDLPAVLTAMSAALTLVMPVNHESDSVDQIQRLTDQFGKQCSYVVVRNAAHNLEDRAASEIVQPAPLVTPTRLLAVLDKAKAFPLLKKQHPEAVAGAEARTFGDEPQITDFNDYEIRLEEVFRFNPEDTLVFHVTLRNKSAHPIRYLPESFCVRVGNRLYHQSISDAPGLLPPHAASTVYFAITGTPDGGRNELSLKNEFSVLVSRLPSPPPSAATTPPTAPPPAPSPQKATEMTPEQESRARETLRQAVEDLENTNAPSAKPANP